MSENYANLLLDHAGGHNIKILGRCRVTRHNVEIIKNMICDAALRLRSMPAGDVVIVEGIRPDLFIVARSREDKSPACCARCEVVRPRLVLLPRPEVSRQ